MCGGIDRNDGTRGHSALIRATIGALIGAALLAADAAAQPVLVGAGYHREVKRFSGDPDLNVLDTQANGVHVAVGTSVTPRFLVSLEVAFNGESTRTRTTSVVLGGRPLNVTTHYRNQLNTVSALAGVQGPPAGRLRLTYLAGLTFAHVRRRIDPEGRAPILDPAPPPTASELVDNVAAPTVGLNAAIEVARHVSFVASLRAHALRLSADLAGFSIRPGAGVQFVF
jgi:hypothetical protein